MTVSEALNHGQQLHEEGFAVKITLPQDAFGPTIELTDLEANPEKLRRAIAYCERNDFDPHFTPGATLRLLARSV